MSRSTPRKSRGQQQSQQPAISHPHSHQSTTTPNTQHRSGGGHGHQRTRSQHLAAQAALNNQITSDYESDTASYMAAHPAPPTAALAHRTNTDLNLSVLQRYLPSITQIKSQAANAVVYTFSADSTSWDKSGIEGTMFVCAQNVDATPRSSAQGYQHAAGQAKGCIFILNRRGLNNMILDLSDVEAIEASEELLIFKLNGETDEGNPRVVGLWIHADEESTRSTNTRIVQEMWDRVREMESIISAQGTANLASGQAAADYGPAMQAIGRKVSLSDLFGR
ncbi:dcp1-like decapping family domain-containing protein [Apiospora arundinis]|uniref:Dcp1-like decapping family protein n=1 Tax=Apiospora arundinis TaxID=335852 RepID=A0ABR2I8D8_9PEZI